MANSNPYCFLKIFIFHYKFPSKHLIHNTQTLILCAYDDLLRYFLAISATPCAVWILRSILIAESTHWQIGALQKQSARWTGYSHAEEQNDTPISFAAAYFRGCNWITGLPSLSPLQALLHTPTQSSSNSWFLFPLLVMKTNTKCIFKKLKCET